jgi:hypothetical protein
MPAMDFLQSVHAHLPERHEKQAPDTVSLTIVFAW